MSKIELINKGNIFTSKCSTIVCPVNSLGVMGAGLALKFKDDPIFYQQNQVYKDACMTGIVAPGSVVTALSGAGLAKKNVLYATTKLDFRDPSKMEWIETCLFNIYIAMNRYNLTSLAIPALGAGLGGLPWPPIENMIKELFSNDSKTVEVYSPL